MSLIKQSSAAIGVLVTIGLVGVSLLGKKHAGILLPVALIALAVTPGLFLVVLLKKRDDDKREEADSPSAPNEPEWVGSGEWPVRSLPWQLLLVMFTLGVYIPFWLGRTTDIINKRMPAKTISRSLVMLNYALFLAAAVCLAIIIVSSSDKSVLGNISALINLVTLAPYLVLLFKVRNRMNELLSVDRMDPKYLYRALTLILGILYLQAKINQRPVNDKLSQAQVWKK